MNKMMTLALAGTMLAGLAACSQGADTGNWGHGQLGSNRAIGVTGQLGSGAIGVTGAIGVKGQLGSQGAIGVRSFNITFQPEFGHVLPAAS